MAAFLLLAALSGCDRGQKQSRAEGELVIDTFLESRFLEFAARKFEELNEGVTITINVFTHEQERDNAKFSQIINTELMGGRGADIICVGYLNWMALADRGRLLDLSDKITFSPEEHYISILDAFLYNGRRYVIPLSFTFTALRFDSAFAGIEQPGHLTLDGLLSLAARYPDNPLFLGSFVLGQGKVALAYKMFNLDFDYFMDLPNRTANVDNERFISMLESINEVRNIRWIQPSETAVLLELVIFNPVMTNIGVEDYSDVFLLTNDKGEALAWTLGFIPAVNANSQNQELAVEFIRFLVSKEVQSSLELRNNPINKMASAEMAALLLDEIRAGGYGAYGFDLENNIRLFNELVEQINVVETSDTFIIRFVREELGRFFSGEVSAEQAARNLQSRLNMYLRE
jgi:multiple sugar transport system substrate-binding protein